MRRVVSWLTKDDGSWLLHEVRLALWDRRRRGLSVEPLAGLAFTIAVRTAWRERHGPGIRCQPLESAAVVTLALLFGKRGGSICSVADNLVTGEKFEAGAGHNNAIRVGLQGLAILHEMDNEKQRAGQAYWTPSLRPPAP